MTESMTSPEKLPHGNDSHSSSSVSNSSANSGPGAEKPTRKFAIQVSTVTWIILGIAVLITLFSHWYFTNFDKIYYERDTGYSVEAKRNQFLAAQQFLQQFDINFEIRNDFGVFDEPIGQFDTIFVNTSRVGMAAKRREAMTDWVKQGGHLVLLATEFYEYDFESSRDKFLDSLGLRFYSTDDDYTSYDDNESMTSFDFEGYDKETKVLFYDRGYIEDTSGEASFVAGPDHADQFVQYRLEEGLVSVLIDFSIWGNYRIDSHDHAMFLTQLIGGSEKAWLVYNRNQPSLVSLMFQHMPLIFLACAVILLAIILGQLWRVGSPIADSAHSQREIMQHIAAAGEFAYRADKGQSLLDSLNEGIHSRMAQLVHGYSRLSPAKQIEKLSAVSGIEKDRLLILWREPIDSQDAFLTRVQLVQEIRKHL